MSADTTDESETNAGESPCPSFGRELFTICHRARQVWQLIPRRQKWMLGGAVVLMALGSFSNTAIALLLGTLVDAVQVVHGGSSAAGASHLAFGLFPATVLTFLMLIGIAYLVREGLQVARRYLVEDMSTRLEQHLFLTLVSHLLMADLALLSQEKIGALHGRIARNVAGSVKFLRVGFLDWRSQNINATSELIAVGERSLGRLNAESYQGFGVRTEAQRWLILHSRSGKSYTG